MSNIQINSDHTVKSFTLVLAKTNHEHFGQISNATNIVYKGNLNSANELSFTVYKEINGIKEPLWNEIRDLRLVYVKEMDEYFQIKVPMSESSDTSKSVTGASQCEAELGQTLISLEINSEDDISRSDYDPNFPTVFYRDITNLSRYNDIWNANISQYTVFTENKTVDTAKTNTLRTNLLKNSSLMHRMLYKNPNYTIGHIDESLMDLERTLGVSDTSLYDFLTGDVSEQFGCIFQFDTVKRSISAYDLYTVCMNDQCSYLSEEANRMKLRYRGEFSDKCPKCGGTHLKYYGKDTTILVGIDNLTDQINYETDVDSIKNTFKLEAGDELMTAQVVNCNPGGNYIIHIAPELKVDMSQRLQEKLDEYFTVSSKIEEPYQEYVNQWQMASDQIDYLTHTMMPAITDIENGIATVSASTEIAKITEENLSPMAVSSLKESTTCYTISSALENYVKVFVKTGYVKVNVFDDSFQYLAETDPDDPENTKAIHQGIWKGKFRVTNYSDENDVKETQELIILISDNYQTFIRQKIIKNIADQADDDHSVFDVLNISDISEFKDTLKLYCLERLKSFHDAIEAACNALIEVGQAQEGSEFYEDIYKPYWERVLACSDEMDLRQREIEDQQSICNYNLDKMNNIRKEMNFENFLGQDLYKEFCSFRREDLYSNQNYISDGMTTAETIAYARKYLDQAKKEIVKYSTPQHSISATLYNLLLIPAFQPLIDHFQLGNWLRFQVDDAIYRLRLIAYELNFNDIANMNVEFSTATKTADGYNDIESILSQAASTSTTISLVAKQAQKGDSANTQMEHILKEGLNSALVNIRSNDCEEIMIDNTGIRLRTYDDTTGSYALEQGWLTHNLFVYSDDGFKTAKTAFGKHNYYTYDEASHQFVWKEGYGISADFLTAPYIYSGEIIGGDIYSTNYSANTGTHMNLNTGDFTFAGGKLVYDSTLNKLTLKGVEIEWASTTTPKICDIYGLEEQLLGIQDDLDQLDGRIQTFSQASDPSIQWTTTTEMQNHVGDLWFNPNTGITQRWNGTAWEKTTDSDLTLLAQSKAQIFTATPAPPYYEGDLWVQGSKGDILNCVNTRTNGLYTASDWAKSSKYTDDAAVTDLDTKISQILAGEYTTTIGKDYVISPHIAGGYAYFQWGDFSVEIDPNHSAENNTLDGWLFAVRDKNTDADSVIMGVDTQGNGFFKGSIYASDGQFSGDITGARGTFGEGDYSVTIDSNGLSSKSFCLDKDGARFTGELSATGGNIGGFYISTTTDSTTHCYTNSLYRHSYDGTYYYEVGMKGDGNTNSATTSSNLAFYVKRSSTNNWASSDNMFYVTHGGKLYCSNADISGKITATGGTIGGWTITPNKIYGGNESTGVAAIQYPREEISWVFAAGGTSHESYSNCPFRVSKDGALYSTKASVTGNINATNIKAKGSYYIYDSDENKQVKILSCINDNSSDTKFNFGRLSDNGYGAGLNYISFIDMSDDRQCHIYSNYLEVHGKLYSDGAIFSDGAIYTGSGCSFHVDTKGDGLTSDAGGWMIRFADGANHNNMTMVANSQYTTSVYGDGNIWKNGSSTTYFSTSSTDSDRRLKEHVSDLSSYENFFMSLKPICFKYHDKLFNPEGTKPLIKWGFYAQDIIADFEENQLDWSEYDLVMKEMTDISSEERKYIDDSCDGILKVSYQNFTALNTYMIQQAFRKIGELEETIQQLKNQ